MAEGNGHGSVILDDDGQGSTMVYVHNNGGDENYTVGNSESAQNQSGGTVSEGDVVIISWDADLPGLIITKKGDRATGNVSEEGDTITITDPGNTDLDGTVSISTSHGSNEGYGGASGVRCANVGGKAAYLSAE